jgi:hypothetical protein
MQTKDIPSQSVCTNASNCGAVPSSSQKSSATVLLSSDDRYTKLSYLIMDLFTLQKISEEEVYSFLSLPVYMQMELYAIACPTEQSRYNERYVIMSLKGLLDRHWYTWSNNYGRARGRGRGGDNRL